MAPKRRARPSAAVNDDNSKAATDGRADEERQLFRGSPMSESGETPNEEDDMQVESDDAGLSQEQSAAAGSSSIAIDGDDTSMVDVNAASIGASEPKATNQKAEETSEEPAGDGETVDVQKSETKSTLDDRETVVESPTGDLLASLPVYMSKALPSTSLLQIFQFPTYERGKGLRVPTSARERGLHPAIRVRPRAKRIEMELPLDLRPKVYDTEKGEEYGRGAAANGTIGPGNRTTKEEPRVKSEFGGYVSSSSQKTASTSTAKRLEKTRLESNQLPHQTNYMIGVIRDKALHLTPVDSIHQLRPSMHYLDALQALERQGNKSGDGDDKSDSEGDGEGEGVASAPANGRSANASAPKIRKPQGVNVSIRNNNDMSPGGGGGGGGSGSGGGTRGFGGPKEGRDALMQPEHEAQSERWIELDWKDERSDESRKAFDSQMFAVKRTPLQCTTKPREFLQHIT